MASGADKLQAGLPVHCGMVSVVALRGAREHAQILLARRASEYLHDAWSYIAGHVVAGEAGWQAARRELYEETGLVPDVLYATGFCEQFYAAQVNCIEIVPAFVAWISSTAVVHLNAEHSAFRWASLDEAAALLPFGSQRDLLGHVRREFVTRAASPFLKIALD